MCSVEIRQTDTLLRYRALVIVLCTVWSGLMAGCTENVVDTAAPPTTAPPVQGTAVASAKGRVDIEGGVIRLAARRDGVIARVLVEEGARVKAGQLLATLDDELARRSLALAQSEVAEARHALLGAEIEHQAARRELERLRPLANTSLPRVELDRAHDAVHLAEAAVASRRTAIATAQARADLAAQELEEHKVIAPLAGEIIQRQARPGNGVSTLNVTPLFLFAPDTPLLVRAELEEQFLAAVALNQPAEIILEADPSRTWNGAVLRIGRVVGERTPSEDPAEKKDNRVVEVVLTLDASAVLIGQRVIVRFLTM